MDIFYKKTKINETFLTVQILNNYINIAQNNSSPLTLILTVHLIIAVLVESHPRNPHIRLASRVPRLEPVEPLRVPVVPQAAGEGGRGRRCHRHTFATSFRPLRVAFLDLLPLVLVPVRIKQSELGY